MLRKLPPTGDLEKPVRIRMQQIKRRPKEFLVTKHKSFLSSTKERTKLSFGP